MRICITGVAGFLGSHLAEYFLKRGDFVLGIDNMSGGFVENLSPLTLFGDKFKFYEIDCTNFGTVNSVFKDQGPIDVVYHCAALAHEGLSVFAPSLITKSIFEASVAVFSASVQNKVKRIVNCSSMARYGELPHHKFGSKALYNEFMQCFPRDPYGIAKKAAEDVLECLSDTHGVEFVNLVPHNIIGTRQNYTDPHRNVASIMMNRLKQGKDVIIYGDGTQTRCFSPVADVIGSMVEAGNLNNHNLNGHTINIGPDSYPVSINELARRLYKLAKRDFNPTYMPDRPREVKHALCSSNKARDLLGYKEVQTLDQCLLEMWNEIPEGGKPFKYESKPLEIINDLTPKTWTDRLI